MWKAGAGPEQLEEAVPGAVCGAEHLQIILHSELVHVDLQAQVERGEIDAETIAMIVVRVQRGFYSGFPMPPQAGHKTTEQARYLLDHWPADPSKQVYVGAIDERCPHIPLPAPIFHAMCGMEP